MPTRFKFRKQDSYNHIHIIMGSNHAHLLVITHVKHTRTATTWLRSTVSVISFSLSLSLQGQSCRQSPSPLPRWQKDQQSAMPNTTNNLICMSVKFAAIKWAGKFVNHVGSAFRDSLITQSAYLSLVNYSLSCSRKN